MALKDRNIIEDDLGFAPANKLREAIRQKYISPVEIVEVILRRIEKINPQVNAFCTVVPEIALQAARKVEEELTRGQEIKPLHGIPVSIKDLTITAGIRTTFGSKIFENYIPEEDALIVQRLKRAGAIILGKTNTPEFGAGANTYNTVFGATRNPWGLTHTCGGSSGGAAVALACGLGPLATGSDLGGSLRIPASFCGVVGFRTTPGLIPIYPRLLGWDTMTVEGPMARTVKDMAIMLSVMAGRDDLSPISLPVEGGTFLSAVENPDIKNLKIAWSPDLRLIPVDNEVKKISEAAAYRFEELGAVVTTDQPDYAGLREVIQVTRAWRMAALYAEALKKFRDQMNPNLVANIEQGLKLSGEAVGRAEKNRTLIYQRVHRFFEKYDLLVTPTVAIPPFPVEIPYPKEINGQPMADYTDWFILTYAISITGHPAISIPCGFTAAGFPVGLQIIGRRLAEATVLKAAAAFEIICPWIEYKPQVACLSC
ncbi:MAG: amidase [Thermodesulfobacteriota bacterium]